MRSLRNLAAHAARRRRSCRSRTLSSARTPVPAYLPGKSRNTTKGDDQGMSELAIEQTPDVADAAREAAGGQVVYITERGQRVAGIIPADLAATLEGLSADDLEQFAEAAAAVGRENL